MRISWDGSNRPYSQGVQRGVLYPETGPGVPWNGLVSVTEKGDDSPTSFYLDGQRYSNTTVPSDYAGTIQAFTYPDEFEPCIGVAEGWITAQPKQTFGLSYRDNRELHLIFNIVTTPSNDQYASKSPTTGALSFSWSFVTTPNDIPAGRASAHLVVMLDYASPDAVSDLEAIIYGDDENDPSLPDPATIIDIFESHTTIRITDNGDGTWTADGPDELITIDGDDFTIDGGFVTVLDSDTYKIRSL